MKMQYEVNIPEFLKNCFEKDFPFIYVGDTVKVSSRWSGDSKNPNKGKSGKVESIQHNLESEGNRDYIDLTVIRKKDRFNTYLYTLNLVKRKPENADLFRKGEVIYLNDRIEVVDENHPKYGAIGRVVGISGCNGTINFVANDESVYRKFREINLQHIPIINKKTEEKVSDKAFFSAFNAKLKKKIPLFGEFPKESEKLIRNYFEIEARRVAIKEVTSQPDYVSQVDELNKELKFLADSSSVKMVEMFPPNSLFKID